MQRTRPCLVIGCGTACELHPAKDWFSVDLTEAKRPNLCIDYKKLKPEDYSENDEEHNKVKLINNSKFDLILLKQIPPFRAPSTKRLKTLLAKDAALVFFGSQKADPWRHYAKADLPISSFIYSHHVLILALENCSMRQTLEKVRCDLVQAGKPETFLKFMTLVEKEMKELEKKYDYIDPILISVMAHLCAYVKDREERPIWSFFSLYGAKRNLLHDADYRKFALDVEETVVQFGMHHISYEVMQAKIEKWKDKFPSSVMGSEKLDYNKLWYLLDICSDAIKFYAKKFIIEEEIKPGMRPKG